MLSERELKQAAAQLQEFRVAAENHSKTNVEILARYAQLLEDYQRLKSEHEEEREPREKYKQLAKGQERNPFVLVLVDGDGYVFDDDLVSSGAEGGSRAAQLLNSAVKTSLQTRGLGHCKIMVRIYANISGLSKALSRVKLSGPEKRSLAPFVANFNRSNELFDFVDAGELRENADFKIRSLFNLYADNSQCKHIYFAACHDVSYINGLTPHASSRDRITLIRTHSFHKEFTRLGLRIEDLQGLFRTTPLDPITPVSAYQKPLPTTSGYQKPVTIAQHVHRSNSATDATANICTFYQKGNCRYGNTCKNLHIDSHGNSNGYAATKSSDSHDWRKDASSNKTSPPTQLPHSVRSDTDFMRGNVSIAPQSPPDFSSRLPREENIPPGKIPLNSDQHRIDAYIPPSTHDDRATFKARTAKRKVCNNFHLKNYCSSGDSCPYDHNPITNGIKSCLKEVARGMPCTRRGICRDPRCFQGHICQLSECKHRGGKVFCKLPYSMHNVDLVVVDYVDGIIKDTGSWDDTASTSTPVSPEQDSEGEDEGAAIDQNPDREPSVD